ncbi:ABC transporter ATP-binding protein [Spiroplasma gladiatoris]|uniref:ABC transporter ATP-binding protein n=1 Tax=Spiroplasma gladiatoris TaxID=2143 RepID=A0A4V1AQ60_9MOLU|nr:ABC transporter ATP-binding protein [Spiroplasma gladiatoris]QBQ07369.1 ABC transporter ATP-binding protein [Spiroplasma gladiatoris]
MKKIIKKYWMLIFLCLFFEVIGQLLFIGSNYFQYTVVNKVIQENKSINEIWLETLFAFGGVIVSLTITYFSDLMRCRISYKLRINLKQIVSFKINSLSDEEYEKNKKGEYISWYNNEVEAISAALEAKLISIYVSLVLTILPITLLFIFVHWIVGLVALFGGLLTIFVPSIAGIFLSKKYQEIAMEQGEFTQGIENLINGYAEFAYQNKKGLFRSLIEKFSNKMESKVAKVSYFTFGISLLIGILQVVLQQSTFVGSTILYYNGIASPGAVMVSINFSAYFIEGFSSLIENITSIGKGKGIIKKYKNIREYQEYTKNSIPFKELNINKLNCEIEQKQIFKDFNLQIDANKKYLVVGESGKGKTTLFKIIFGILNKYSGDLILNKEINYKTLVPEDLKNLYSYVPQETTIFNDTIRNNISLWNKEIDDKKIIEALKKVNLSSLLKDNTLDTVINYDNKNFSGGELQRIAIARALVDEKQVMIMDEITASLDKENRQNIENLVGELDKTVLYISHTTSTNDKNFDVVVKL